jgi:hypothetical protein
MAGFLDSKERVIDMVLTDTGKSLLLRGDLQFAYWIPLDDEVDYDPPSPITASGQSLEDRRTQLTETPLIREAAGGYKGLNLREEDTTNVYRPMYSAHPGVGQNVSQPLPQMVVDVTGVQVEIKQALVMKYYGDQTSQATPERVGINRYDPSSLSLSAQYSTGSYPPDMQTEGFLITIYQSSSLKIDENDQAVGGYREILHNIDSSGSIVYLNDLKLVNDTP